MSWDLTRPSPVRRHVGLRLRTRGTRGCMQIAPGTLRRMVELRDQCLLRIVGPDDVDVAYAVLAHLAAIARDVAQADEVAVSFVSEVIASPVGPNGADGRQGIPSKRAGTGLGGPCRSGRAVGLAIGDDRGPAAWAAPRLTCLRPTRRPGHDSPTSRSLGHVLAPTATERMARSRGWVAC